MKSALRIKMEQVAEFTGKSLVYVNYAANCYVNSGLCANIDEALNYMLHTI